MEYSQYNLSLNHHESYHKNNTLFCLFLIKLGRTITTFHKHLFPKSQYLKISWINRLCLIYLSAVLLKHLVGFQNYFYRPLSLCHFFLNKYSCFLALKRNWIVKIYMMFWTRTTSMLLIWFFSQLQSCSLSLYCHFCNHSIQTISYN